MQDCPQCSLLSPDVAQRCDCGYDFQSLEMKPSYLASPAKLPRGHRRFLGWKAWVCAITVSIAYVATEIVLWGAVSSRSCSVAAQLLGLRCLQQLLQHSAGSWLLRLSMEPNVAAAQLHHESDGGRTAPAELPRWAFARRGLW